MYFRDSSYYTATGKSEVKIWHRGKEYVGYAYLHPEDKEQESQFTGCRYAEIRGQIKALKEEYRCKKEACEECRRFVKSLECYKNWNKDNTEARLVYRQLNRRIREVNKLVDKINELELNLLVSIRQKDYLLNKRKNNKND